MYFDSYKIETIKNYFKTRPVFNVYLFGSYVRGNADNESDIDLLVDLDYSQKVGLQFIQPRICSRDSIPSSKCFKHQYLLDFLLLP